MDIRAALTDQIAAQAEVRLIYDQRQDTNNNDRSGGEGCPATRKKV